MRKFILIRGHSGSGKSTFAKQKIAEFRQNFPESRIFHIENDRFLYENGKYIWTKARFQQAKNLAEQELELAWQFARDFPEQSVLIVVSNVNTNLQAVEKYQEFANSLGMEVEIYRLMNFFKNRHNVNLYKVLKMYLALENQPLTGEIKIPAIKKMPHFMQEIVEKLQQRDKNQQLLVLLV